MKRCTIVLAGLLGLAIGLPTAQAAIILADDFDSYANQAAFEAAWTPIGSVAPQSATLTSAQFVSAPNSVEVAGTATTGQQRNQRNFAETTISTTEQIVWSFDFYDTNSAASPYRQYSNLQDGSPTATNQLIAMGLNNNQTSGGSGGNHYMARILGYSPTTVDPDGGPNESITGSGAFFKLNDFGAGLRSTGWHNLKVVLSTDDGLSTDYEFFVDGVLAERVSNVGTAASIRSYDNIRLGSGLSNAENGAFYDNMRLEVVPEPTSIGLACLAVVGMAIAGRRRLS